MSVVPDRPSGMGKKRIPTPCPASIRSRGDAVALWKHLLTMRIAFCWDEDPSGWVSRTGEPTLSDEGADNIQRLFNEVAELNNPICYRDAVSLTKIAQLFGVDAVRNIPTRLAHRFEGYDCFDEYKKRFKRLVTDRLKPARNAKPA